MHPKFAAVIEALHPLFHSLVSCPPIRDGNLNPEMPRVGVYLFSEGNEHQYVGRSNNLRQRYRQHTNPSAGHNQAVFAFKMTRQSTGRLTPSYVAGSLSRAGLVADTEFGPAFIAAKARVRNMDYRCVEVRDPMQQALLEAYCAIALECKFNDFENH